MINMEKTRRTLFVVLMTVFCLAPLMPVKAAKGEMKYSMEYIIQQRLFVKGQQVTLLNTNLEWPVCVAGTDVFALRNYLSQLFFDGQQTSPRSALETYAQSFGTEIHAMPEGEGYQVQYVDLFLQVLGGVEGQYISFYALKQKRKSDSAKAEERDLRLFTYNLVKDKVLTARDILVSTIFPKESQHMEFIEYLYAIDGRLRDDEGLLETAVKVSQSDVEALPDQACLLPMGVALNFKVLSNGLASDRLTLLPRADMDYWMKSSIKNWLLSKKRVGSDYVTPVKPIVVPKEGDDSCTVYDLVEEMPEFNGGEKGMMEFIAKTAKYPDVEQQFGHQGKVVVAFVVERDGSVSSPAVISPISPILDREAVEAVIAMPAWKPGRYNGQPVRTRMVVPVTYKLR